MKLARTKPNVIIVGSINMDFVVTAEKWPSPGETMVARKFDIFPGGKGANQAVASARACANVTFIGAVGSDNLGREAIKHLKSQEINTENILVKDNATTGKAIVTVVNGENSILINEGANGRLTVKDIVGLSHLIAEADIVLMQNEIPNLVQEQVVDICQLHCIPVVYNPAPARKLTRHFLENITYLTPNEHEYKTIFSTDEPLIRDFHSKVIQTKGANGIEYWQNHSLQKMAGIKVDTVDTTGAGDTFNGVLTVELARGATIHDAIETANIAASISVQKNGAQQGMPTQSEISKARKQLEIF
ncbi:ribokinase [Gracilibacillus salinarum]|uniref:Ribokinase n=1 Tax=Gracilibacillus salinarum TaxID=2932255 RepID=A0ABY4GRY0_9BACI|nr:ribokinase [Gracilibacillus salinarum]UOQ86999.1 ribokinase [Gracilibacillus salinarum]